MVLKDTLQWDPMIDVLLNRLPMAATMGPRDALLIFPEGGNVLPRRQRQAIERLRSSGRESAAARAEGIVHLLPPRPRGVQAALRWHAVSASEVPSDEQGLSDWLFTEWEQMDAWVTAHRAEPDPVGDAP